METHILKYNYNCNFIKFIASLSVIFKWECLETLKINEYMEYFELEDQNKHFSH